MPFCVVCFQNKFCASFFFIEIKLYWPENYCNFFMHILSVTIVRSVHKFWYKIGPSSLNISAKFMRLRNINCFNMCMSIYVTANIHKMVKKVIITNSYIFYKYFLVASNCWTQYATLLRTNKYNIVNKLLFLILHVYDSLLWIKWVFLYFALKWKISIWITCF